MVQKKKQRSCTQLFWLICHLFTVGVDQFAEVYIYLKNCSSNVAPPHQVQQTYQECKRDVNVRCQCQ